MFLNGTDVYVLVPVPGPLCQGDAPPQVHSQGHWGSPLSGARSELVEVHEQVAILKCRTFQDVPNKS